MHTETPTRLIQSGVIAPLAIHAQHYVTLAISSRTWNGCATPVISMKNEMAM